MSMTIHDGHEDYYIANLLGLSVSSALATKSDLCYIYKYEQHKLIELFHLHAR